ncbi:MAG TPA: DUF192 domain-containing protein, partial [bacterium (Candidatus Stahlbacteria)]|nr:DUF192 domain-containing protein [Candidatus Stahlbacteria bacterium]
MRILFQVRPYHLILFLLSACTNTKGWLAIIGDDTIKVKVLIEEYELTTGLMFHKTLDSDSGYLFLFPRPGRYPFWMKNTYIPLSIAFIDSEDRIIAIDSMIPLDTVRIFPPGLIT